MLKEAATLYILFAQGSVAQSSGFETMLTANRKLHADLSILRCFTIFYVTRVQAKALLAVQLQGTRKTHYLTDYANGCHGQQTNLVVSDI